MRHRPAGLDLPFRRAHPFSPGSPCSPSKPSLHFGSWSSCSVMPPKARTSPPSETWSQSQIPTAMRAAASNEDIACEAMVLDRHFRPPCLLRTFYGPEWGRRFGQCCRRSRRWVLCCSAERTGAYEPASGAQRRADCRPRAITRGETRDKRGWQQRSVSSLVSESW